jgi:tRNA-dihydrouridine synthase 3
MNVDFVDVNMVCDVALKINSETTHVNDEVIILKIELLKKKSLLCFCFKK